MKHHFASFAMKQWLAYANLLLRKLTKNGFTHASDCFLQKLIPFITAWGGDLIPVDDPRWEDPEFEPDPITATTFQCLFGEDLRL